MVILLKDLLLMMPKLAEQSHLLMILISLKSRLRSFCVTVVRLTLKVLMKHWRKEFIRR